MQPEYILPPFSAFLWRIVIIDSADPDACWGWIGAKGGPGQYPHIRWNHRNWKIHRVTLAYATGEYHPHLESLHSCDNADCTNPRHLRWGTSLENSADMISRGRGSTAPRKVGAEHGMAKLTEIDVIEIRRLYDSGTRLPQLMKLYPMVSKNTIWRACKRMAWTHI